MVADSRVFISYARKDGRALALQLRDDLESANHEVWLDTANIGGGADWALGIEQAIDNCTIALVLLSAGSYVSEICRGEQLRALRQGKRVIPLLVQADADRPVYLEHLNYRDFSNASGYADALNALLTEIETGEIVELPEAYRQTSTNAPSLPDHYVERVGALDDVRQALLSDNTDRRVALTALQGLGGIGKSVLAAALCRDDAIQNAFPDGIVWVTIGREPGQLVEQMRLIGTRLGDDAAHYRSQSEATARLRELLPTKSALIVLDDVWDGDHLKLFIADAPRCRVLFTSRDAGLATSPDFTAELIQLGTLKPEEALQLLRDRVGDDDPAYPEIARRLGYLPLALALVGAQMARGTGGVDWLASYEHMSQIKLKRRPGSPHESLTLCFDLSTAALPAEDVLLYYTFGIFPEDVWIPQHVVTRLWQQLEPDLITTDCAELTDELAQMALLTKRVDDDAIILHDLLHDYTREKLGAQYIPTQQALLTSYNPNNRHWAEVSDDGYLYDNLAYHLHEATRDDDLLALFADQQWMNARFEHDGYTYTGYIADLMLTWEDVAFEQARAQLAAGQDMIALPNCVRLALIRTSINSLAGNYVPAVAARAVVCNIWTVARALSIARNIPNAKKQLEMYIALLSTGKLSEQKHKQAAQAIKDERARASVLSALADKLAGEQWHRIFTEALAAAQAIQSEVSRTSVLSALADKLAGEQVTEALAAAQAIQDEKSRARVLSALADKLAGEQVTEALAAAQAIQSEKFRAKVLSALADKLAGEQVTEALAAAQAIQSEVSRARVLSALADKLAGKQVTEALAAAQTIQDEMSRASVLSALADKFDTEQRHRILTEALAAAQAIQSEKARASVLSALADKLAEEQVTEALAAAQAIQSERARASVLSVLADKLEREQRHSVLTEALTAAQAIRSVRDRASALSALADKLTGEQVTEALAAAKAIQPEGARAKVLSALADKLAGEQVTEALAAAQAIQDEGDHARVLSTLADKLGGKQRHSVLTEALAAAQAIQSEVSRASALSVLASKFDTEQRHSILAEALVAAQAIQSEVSRASLLSALADKLEGEQRHSVLTEALAAAKAIQSMGHRARVLSVLANKFDPKLRYDILAEALAAAKAIRSEVARASVLSALVNRLEGEQVTEALAIAKAIQDKGARASVLSVLANKFDTEQRHSILTEGLAAAKAIQDESSRASALSALANKFDTEQRHSILTEGLAAAKAIQDEGSRASALSALANRLAGEQVTEALATAQAIQSEKSRARVLSALADKLAGEQVTEALAAAKAIQDEGSRASALSALANKFDTEHRLVLFLKSLQGFQNAPRSVVMSFCRQPAWFPPEYVSEDTVFQITRHIQEICTEWVWL
jgi:1,2-phenylacetyl-CoA epoxidase catalytic subunit